MTVDVSLLNTIITRVRFISHLPRHMEAEDGEAAVTLDALADDALQQIVAA